jgi:hypothetical protein
VAVHCNLSRKHSLPKFKVHLYKFQSANTDNKVLSNEIQQGYLKIPIDRPSFLLLGPIIYGYDLVLSMSVPISASNDIFVY